MIEISLINTKQTSNPHIISNKCNSTCVERRKASLFGCVTAAFFNCSCDCKSLIPEDHPATFSVVRALIVSRSSYRDIFNTHYFKKRNTLWINCLYHFQTCNSEKNISKSLKLYRVHSTSDNQTDNDNLWTYTNM